MHCAQGLHSHGKLMLTNLQQHLIRHILQSNVTCELEYECLLSLSALQAIASDTRQQSRQTFPCQMEPEQHTASAQNDTV